MNKEKQIQEMYQEFLQHKHDTMCKVFSYKGMCENFINLGYRKINDNEVVISKEEYEGLTNQNKGLKEENHILRLENNDLEAQVKLKSKETAEKCRDFVKQWAGNSEEGLGFLFDFEDFIAKQFGVKLGE